MSEFGLTVVNRLFHHAEISARQAVSAMVLIQRLQKKVVLDRLTAHRIVLTACVHGF